MEASLLALAKSIYYHEIHMHVITVQNITGYSIQFSTCISNKLLRWMHDSLSIM